MNAATFGKGNVGAIKIIASETISAGGGESSQGFSSGIFSQVDSTAMGNSGGIEISTGSLSLNDGATVNAATFGKGNVGAIKITASETISAGGGESSQGFGSGIFSQVDSTAMGNSGGIEISTGSLSLNDGAVVNASTSGSGNAGEIKITASDSISVAGENSQGFSSGIYSQVDSTAEGNSGGIELTTGFLFLTDGGQISASDGGQISASAFLGKGNAGAIKFTASDFISLTDEDSQDIFSQVESTTQENARSNGFCG